MSLEELDEAQRLMAVVDTIIFEDGRVIGPDESRLADFIQGIAVSIKALVNEIRKALSEGRDLDEILTFIGSHYPAIVPAFHSRLRGIERRIGNWR